MKINKEGYTIVTTTLCVGLIVASICFLYAPLWVAWIVSGVMLLILAFTISFFREPRRAVLKDSGLVYSSADGTIVAIEEVQEREYLGDRRIQVSVFMSISNVHINWFPVGGKVEYFKYHPGNFMVAWNPKSSEANERTTTVIDTGREKVLFRQIAGFVARRIVSYAEVGGDVEQNQKCGFIKFGSRIDLFLPLDCEILVGMEDKVVGSQTPIARLKEKK